MLKAISLDFWDTIYLGAYHAGRARMRQTAVGALLAAVGRGIDERELLALYREARDAAERWWTEEQRGYTADERIRWMLGRLGVERPAGCAHVARTVAAVDEALVELPPPLLEGAAEAVRRLAARWPLAIVSDTGFASGRAQDLVLARDGLLEHFAVRIYSCDIGHAKPRREPFLAAAERLGVRPEEMLHIGDIERTDVRGAVGAGMRAVRLDALRDSGPSEAERVAGSWSEAVEHLMAGARR
ncbi:MAG TPA: HAD family hydrolase [Gemmatimonadaceae bacterium]